MDILKFVNILTFEKLQFSIYDVAIWRGLVRIDVVVSRLYDTCLRVNVMLYRVAVCVYRAACRVCEIC